MSKVYTVAGFHVSRDDSGDHVFMDVRDITRDGDMSSATWLRFQGTKGIQVQENLKSKAAELCVFVPITHEAGETIRALAWLLMQLSQAKQPQDPVIVNEKPSKKKKPVLSYLPYTFTPAAKRKDVDVLGRMRCNGEQAEFREKPIAANCFDMVILGCALAGIDLAKVFNNEEYADNGVFSRNSTRNMHMKAIVEQAREVPADMKTDDKDEYHLTLSSDGVGVKRVFAIYKKYGSGASPVHAFSSVANNPVTSRALYGSPEVMIEPKRMPVILYNAARRAQIPIPQNLVALRP